MSAQHVILLVAAIVAVAACIHEWFARGRQ